MYQLPLQILVKYWKHILIAIIFAIQAYYFYEVGYDKAESKYEAIRAKEVENELIRLKKVQDELTKMRVKYENLDSEYDKVVKTDVNYNCVVPNSLRQYLNSI